MAYHKNQGFPAENAYQSATGAAVTKETRFPGNQPGGVQKRDPEGYYYSTENEYAYIADVLPPDAGAVSGPMRDEGFYSTGFGPTASISSKNIHPPLIRGTSAHGHPCVKANGPIIAQHPGHMYIDGEEPPKYFELDPQQPEIHGNGARRILAVGKTSCPGSRGRVPGSSGTGSVKVTGSSGAGNGNNYFSQPSMEGPTHNKSV